MTCPTCLATALASDDSLRRLVIYQSRQLDRLLGGGYRVPTEQEIHADLAGQPVRVEKPSASIAATLESVMAEDAIFRKPARVAAPRLLERLTEAGIHLTRNDPGCSLQDKPGPETSVTQEGNDV